MTNVTKLCRHQHRETADIYGASDFLIATFYQCVLCDKVGYSIKTALFKEDIEFLEGIKQDIRASWQRRKIKLIKE